MRPTESSTTLLAKPSPAAKTQEMTSTPAESTAMHGILATDKTLLSLLATTVKTVRLGRSATRTCSATRCVSPLKGSRRGFCWGEDIAESYSISLQKVWQREGRSPRRSRGRADCASQRRFRGNTAFWLTCSRTFQATHSDTLQCTRLAGQNKAFRPCNVVEGADENSSKRRLTPVQQREFAPPKKRGVVKSELKETSLK